MADERPPDEGAVEAPVRPPDNVVPFPTRPTPAEPVTAEELRERLDRITAGADDLLAGTTRIETALEQAKVDRLARLENLIEPLATWVSTGAEARSQEISTLTATMAEGFAAATAARLLEASVAAEARASMRAELASIAARVELIEHPDPEVREVAAEAATGNPEAIDELAFRLSQSTWWERNGSLVTTVAMSLLFIAAAALITAGALSRRERRRLEADQRRALEHRVRQVESNYVQLHGAYSQQQRALAAEQQRPLTATYDQRSFPVYDQHWHEHHHEQHDHRTVIEVDA